MNRVLVAADSYDAELLRRAARGCSLPDARSAARMVESLAPLLTMSAIGASGLGGFTGLGIRRRPAPPPRDPAHHARDIAAAEAKRVILIRFRGRFDYAATGTVWALNSNSIGLT